MGQRVHHSQTFLEGSDLDRLKKGLLWRGFDVGTVRPPLTSLSSAIEKKFYTELETVLTQIDLAISPG